MSLLQSALNKIRGDSPAPAAHDKSSAAPAPLAGEEASNQQVMTQRFAQFVMMQAQQVMMMLGVTPSPYGQMPPQLPEAKMFIDQLEMLSFKTQGRLTRQEAALLAKIIDQCTMAFTKVSGGTPPSLMPDRTFQEISLDELVGPMDEEPEEVSGSPAAPTPSPSPRQAELPSKQPAPAETAKSSPPEDKKKYVKSYGSF